MIRAMNEIVLLGLNHKTAPLELREKLSFPTEEDLRKGLLLLKTSPVEEGVILSTCNRVELYVVLGAYTDRRGLLEGVLSRMKGVPREEFSSCLYYKEGEEAVRHLFSVASSLDSMVVGEPQILGQLKEAYGLAKEIGTVGFLLNRLFQRAFFVGKRVRRETLIGDGAVSVSFVAVELAKRIFGDLKGKRVLVIGAGEMCELAAKHLKAAGAGEIFVTNRTWQRALELARQIQGQAVPFEGFREMLKDVDVVISSTGAPSFILKKEDLSRILKARRGAPLFLIDLAVPRDIDPEVHKLDDVYLYDIDDLEGIALENAKERLQEASKALQIVEEEVKKFSDWYTSLEVVPTIKELKAWAEAIRKREMEQVPYEFKSDPVLREAMERLSERVVNKLLHPVFCFLKKGALNGNAKRHAELVRWLFGLGKED